MKRVLIVVFLSLGVFEVFAQELNAKIQVMAPQIQGTDRRIYNTLQSSIFDFMNNTKWTQDNYKLEERIDCNIVINISDRPSADRFTGTIQIQLNRPIYKSDYNSLVFNFQDQDFQFQYVENTAIIFTPNQHTSNLSSILAFYAYMIIGLDGDTFSKEGGTSHYIKAKEVVSAAQNANEPGWKSFENKKNRFWLVDDILHKSYKPLRQCLYEYHRMGFDIMYDDVNLGRQAVSNSLQLLRRVHQAQPMSFSLQLFFNAKVDEIVNLFGQAVGQEKTTLMNLLMEINPANLNKYEALSKSN